MPRDLFEVIVVDNGSRDNTRSVVMRYASELQLRYEEAPEPGLHVGRHVGFRVARSDLLLYGDDDIEAEPQWVEAVVDAFKDPVVALVGGNNYPRFETIPPDWLSLWWSRAVSSGRALPYLSILDFGAGRFAIDPFYVWGCNFSVRRELVQAARGFHPDAVPNELLRLRGDGETHLARFIVGRGLVALFDSRASVHHFVPRDRMTTSYFRRRAYAQGISDSYSAVRIAGGSRIALGQRARACLRPWLAASRELLRAAAAAANPGALALLRVQLEVIKAWTAGFAFHQAEVRRDGSLLSWVLRESYF